MAKMPSPFRWIFPQRNSFFSTPKYPKHGFWKSSRSFRSQLDADVGVKCPIYASYLQQYVRGWPVRRTVTPHSCRSTDCALTLLAANNNRKNVPTFLRQRRMWEPFLVWPLDVISFFFLQFVFFWTLAARSRETASPVQMCQTVSGFKGRKCSVTINRLFVPRRVHIWNLSFAVKIFPPKSVLSIFSWFLEWLPLKATPRWQALHFKCIIKKPDAVSLNVKYNLCFSLTWI